MQVRLQPRFMIVVWTGKTICRQFNKTAKTIASLEDSVPFSLSEVERSVTVTMNVLTILILSKIRRHTCSFLRCKVTYFGLFLWGHFSFWPFTYYTKLCYDASTPHGERSFFPVFRCQKRTYGPHPKSLAATGALKQAMTQLKGIWVFRDYREIDVTKYPRRHRVRRAIYCDRLLTIFWTEKEHKIHSAIY